MFNLMRFDLLSFLLILFFSVFVLRMYSQNTIEDHSYISASEKIYLQLDRTTYTNDQTIWFKAIVTQGPYHEPTQLSGVLYVELIDDGGFIIDKKIVELKNGIGTQSFQLNKDIAQGRYLIRAYTQWNRNFDPEFYFKQYISIFNAELLDNPVNIIVDKTNNKKKRLKVDLYPHYLDFVHEGPLKVEMNIDGESKYFSVKKGTDNRYRMGYTLPDDSKLLSLSITANNGRRFSKTISLKRNDLDLQFFPEGGKLLHGITSKVGFKAIDENGKGIKVSGTIEDEKGTELLAFKSNAIGMGYFFFTPDSSNYYKVILKESESLSIHSFPKVHSKGQTLKINKNKDVIKIVAESLSTFNDSIYIALKQRGKTQGLVKGFMKGKTFSVELPSNELSDGIYKISWLNKYNQPISERLIFNNYTERRITFNIETDKAKYSQREKLNLKIKTNDSVQASVLVVNKDELGLLKENNQNILSYFLLDSELKGHLENPGFYFQSDNFTNDYNLESLMLTQGWRNYNYKQYNKALSFSNEPALSILGKVNIPENKKRAKKRSSVSMMTLGESPQIQVQNLDSLGNFQFYIAPEYGKQLDVIVQPTNQKGKLKDYNITFKESFYPKTQFETLEAVVPTDSIIEQLVKKDKERKQIYDAFNPPAKAVELEEVIVEANKIPPKRKQMIDLYGEPDTIIGGDTIRAVEKKWSYGLFSVLRANYPEIRIKRTSNMLGDNILYAEIQGNDGLTVIAIDGLPVVYSSYSALDGLPTQDIERIDLVRYVKNRMEILKAVFPNTGLQTLAGIYSVNLISIYTYTGNGFDLHPFKSTLAKTTIPIFSPKQEFYSPKYDYLTEKDWEKPDNRVVVSWHPLIALKNNDEYNLSYYNADNIGEMLVIVEGITPDGKIGYKTLTYEVVRDTFQLN